jgi:hypothetical protein
VSNRLLSLAVERFSGPVEPQTSSGERDDCRAAAGNVYARDLQPEVSHVNAEAQTMLRGRGALLSAAGSCDALGRLLGVDYVSCRGVLLDVLGGALRVRVRGEVLARGRRDLAVGRLQVPRLLPVLLCVNLERRVRHQNPPRRLGVSPMISDRVDPVNTWRVG